MRNASRLVAAVGVALVVTGCTIARTGAPGLTGPSEFALSVLLTATPDSISQDGNSTSTVVLTAFDASGHAAAGIEFRVRAQSYGWDATNNLVPCDVLIPGNLSAQVVMTSSDGKAAVVFTAPPANQYCTTGERIDRVVVEAVAIGTDYETAHNTTVSIQLMPYVVLNPNAPLADFIYSPSAPAAGAFVYFNAASSVAAAGHYLVSYDWDYGDGTYESRTTPTETHDYVAAGTYYVTLTVTDDAGQKASRRRAVVVSGAAPPTP